MQGKRKNFFAKKLKVNTAKKEVARASQYFRTEWQQ